MSAAGAAFGFPRLSGAEAVLAASGDGGAASGQVFEPSLWYQVDSDGKVNINITRAEMGQHIGASPARILADELGAAWDDVQITYVDHQEKWGAVPTAGSRSVWSHWSTYRQAGAAGRLALTEAAAARWGLDPAESHARAGKIISGDQEITFGALVAVGM